MYSEIMKQAETNEDEIEDFKEYEKICMISSNLNNLIDLDLYASPISVIYIMNAIIHLKVLSIYLGVTEVWGVNILNCFSFSLAVFMSLHLLIKDKVWLIFSFSIMFCIDLTLIFLLLISFCFLNLSKDSLSSMIFSKIDSLLYSLNINYSIILFFS
jgi:hypothetical protein